MQQIVILLALVLGIPACSLTAEPEESFRNPDAPTAQVTLSVDDDPTPTVVIELSTTPSPTPSITSNPPSITPNLPTATTHSPSTYFSESDPSVAALLLRNQPVASTTRATSGPTGILFVSTRDSVADIYWMNEEGKEQARLTQNGRNNESPTWSPDGQQIAFLSHEASTTSDTATSHLYVMNSDGTASIDITPNLGQSVESVAWSPNSQRIAFVARPSPTGDAFAGMNIYVVNRDGSELAQITHMDPGTIGCWSPTWSPDGSKLVFICRALMNVAIEIAEADGSDRWDIDYGQVSRVFWLPSGEHIAFTGGICWSVGVFSTAFLLTHSVSGSGQWPCLDLDFEDLSVSLTSPDGVAWSPLDESIFAIQTTSNIQVVDLARYAVSVAQYGSARLNGSPSWSPDGERIAFAADDGMDIEIYILSLESNEVVQLTDNEVDDFMPAWQP